MPSLSAEEFWDLLASSGLVEPAVVTALQQAFSARPGAVVADSRAIASWLAETGVLTRWQARRLGGGDRGPFVIGDYRLLERHEFPGTALLFTARHVPSGNLVSLVRLDPKTCLQPEVADAILRRMTIANQVSDPVLSRTWALEQIGSHRLVVCERIAGEPLADELERRGPLPLAEAGATTLQLAAAVAELHVAGAVHGSVSLDTVLRPQNGAPVPASAAGVRLLQFPLGDDPQRVPLRPPLDTAEQIAQLGRRAAFVAPELTVPGAVCDRRSDVYAIGCILHALVAGRLPGWRGDPRATLRDAALQGPPALGPAVPVEVRTLVGYLAARDPAGRYPGAVEAAGAIATCFGLEWTPPAARAPAAATLAFDVEPLAMPAGVPVIVQGPSARSRTRPPPAARRVPGGASAAAEAWFWKLMAWMFGLFFLAITGLTIAWFTRSGSPRSRPRAPEVRPSRQEAANPTEKPAADPPTKAAQPPPRTAALTASGSSVPAGGSSVAVPPAGLRTGPAVTVVADAPRLPWVSPTDGPPPPLAYLPPGAQLVLLARPAEITADEEGARLLRALGPGVVTALETIVGLCGGAVGDVELVQVAWQVGGAGGLTAGYALQLVPGRTVPDDAAFRSRVWEAGGTREIAGATIHSGRLFGADAAFWLPERERGRVLVVAPPAGIEPLIAMAAGGPEEAAALLPQPLETLRGMLDGTRHFTLFGMPHFLFTSGRGLFRGPLATVADPLAAFLGDDIQAVALSVHAAEDAYAELDVVANRDVPVARLADRLVADAQRLPEAVEDYCLGIDPGAYGRRLVQRLPGMLRILAANLRGAGEGRGVVLNVRLPRQAGHNIALAAELALAQPPGGQAAAAVPSAAVPHEDARAKLRRPITLSFTKDTLEKSIQMVSDEIGVPMEILGGDLQLEGITKNQSFGLDEVDRPAEAVLLTILARANPDGKLIYVIRDRDGMESIVITTRAAAEKRGEPVPPPADTSRQGAPR